MVLKDKDKVKNHMLKCTCGYYGFFCPASEIEGTLELSELYSIVNTEDQPEPVVVDESPSEEDVRFMRKAFDVSTNSKDESTKVRAHYYLLKKIPWLECSM